MNYTEFKAEYERLLIQMLSYKPDEVGAFVYASKLSDLVEEFPEFEKQYDSELNFS